MFAALTFDREPLALSWETFFPFINSWTQIAGGFAMLGLLVWLLAYKLSRGDSQAANLMARSTLGVLLVILLGPIGALVLFLLAARNRGSMGDVRVDVPGTRRSALTSALFIGAFVWAASGYLVLLALYLPELIHEIFEDTPVPAPPAWRQLLQSILWTAAGASAIFAVKLPILADLAQLSPRRVWAIARLSMKEAVRRKVLWVFVALLLVVLFASWFIPHKPEDQVRTYVQVVFLAMAFLMLLAAALISGFGIPDDIRHQTIHTILTKPVQRFEVFLGRFLGYTLLMTAVLVVISGFGLLYVLRNIDREAEDESLKAREAFYGNLSFMNSPNPKTGDNVGREWDYRGYIIGMGRNSTGDPQYAVWTFTHLPQPLLTRPSSRLEFALDIYRTHKGVEGQGIFCTFLVESWRFDPARMQEYSKRKTELEHDPDAADKLAEEFGYFEQPGMEIKDYHTQSIQVPAGLFRNAQAEDKARLEKLKLQPGWEEQRQHNEWPAAPLRVRVRVDPVSGGQFLGMAKYDLFFRLDDDADRTANKLRFCTNFFKGSFGLWLRLCLITGLAVALSTYLSGVITLLATLILYVLGFFQEFITEVALRKNVGGGPLEATMRLLQRPGGAPIAAQTEESAAAQVSTWVDGTFSWSLRRIMNVIPDVARYSFTDFVAEGVAIRPDQMAMSFLLLVGYVLPWAVLAYYLLKWREVASST